MVTKAAEHFLSSTVAGDYNAETWKTFQTLIQNKTVVLHTNVHEWESYRKVKKDTVLHIEVGVGILYLPL